MAPPASDFDLPWFPFWVSDFLTSRAVRMMSPAQVGAYTLLLANQWEGGALPDDIAQLSRIANGADPNDVATVLEQCFVRVDEGWLNERLEEVREEQIEKRMKKVRAGKASAKARKAAKKARRKSKGNKKKEQRSNGAPTPLQQPSQQSSNTLARESESEEEVPPDADASVPHSSSGSGGGTNDARPAPPPEVVELFPEYPAAAEALTTLTGTNVRGPVATLRTSFLYDDEATGSIPDPSVKGRPPDERSQLVARALMDMAASDQNRGFNALALSGFVRKLTRNGGVDDDWASNLKVPAGCPDD